MRDFLIYVHRNASSEPKALHRVSLNRFLQRGSVAGPSVDERALRLFSRRALLHRLRAASRFWIRRSAAVVDLASTTERNPAGRFAVCDSPAPCAGRRSDCCPHRCNRPGTGRTRMGNRARVCSLILRAIQSCCWKFLFDECIRAAALDGMRLSVCPHYQRRLTHPLALARRAAGPQSRKQTFYGIFRGWYFRCAAPYTRAPLFRGKMDLARRSNRVGHCVAQHSMASPPSLAHVRATEQHRSQQ